MADVEQALADLLLRTHGQPPGRTYPTYEVKQIVYPLVAAVENVLAQCDAVDAKTGSYRSILHTTTIRAAITDALGATDE